MGVWRKHIEISDSYIGRFVLKSTMKDEGSQIKDSVMPIGLVCGFFALIPAYCYYSLCSLSFPLLSKNKERIVLSIE